MRKKNRSFLLMSLISASLLVSVFTIVQAQSPAAPAAKATNWSDPATWPNRKVPVAGDKVIIEKDKQVVLDVHSASIEADAEGVAKNPAGLRVREDLFCGHFRRVAEAGLKLWF